MECTGCMKLNLNVVMVNMIILLMEYKILMLLWLTSLI